MSRCKACNNVLSEVELRRPLLPDGSLEDTCTRCLQKAEVYKDGEEGVDLNFSDLGDVVFWKEVDDE